MKIDRLDRPAPDEVRLEIIPLIDVIFCILTFFILAAVGLTRQQAIDLDLPSAETSQPLPGQVDPFRLYVSVDRLGQVYLDQDPIPLDLLYDVLLQFNRANPDGLIVLYASRDARYEDVITVLDVLRSVGGDRVALATLSQDDTLDLVPGEPSPFPDLAPDPSSDFGNPGGSLFDPAPPADSSAPLLPDQPPLPDDPSP